MTIKQLLNNFFIDLTTALNKTDLMQMKNYASDNLTIETNFLNDFSGRNALLDLSNQLDNKIKVKTFRITNQHISYNKNHFSHSGYIIGLFANPPKYFQFGSHFVTDGKIVNNELKIDDFKIEFDWIDHNGLIPANIDASLNSLQLNPKILSELDSPWHRFPKSFKNLTTEEQVIDTYIKYAWSIDQQDFTQMLEVFTSEAKADMSPFGKMNGRREIVNKLKVLRDGQPYFQHSADKFEIKVIDENHALLKIYRNVPHQPSSEELSGKMIPNTYGAYYKSKLIKENDIWKFDWLEYIPGWIKA